MMLSFITHMPVYMTHRFVPYQTLAEQLLPHALPAGNDGAHDRAHLLRVWTTASAIQQQEGGDGEVILAAVLLHDCVAVEKNDPLRPQASRLASDKARGILLELELDIDKIEAVAHAVAAHSYSAQIVPQTLEAQIVQDADRLDAIGMLGVARCFYVAGRMGSRLYDDADPAGTTRPLDDSRFALDHFKTKLFGLYEGFQTRTGQQFAQERQTSMRLFYDALLQEIT
jgi:uncharacterized protein